MTVTVPIANLYRLFAYACGLMPRAGFVDVGRDEPSDTLDLLARIVAEEARAIARRGLARDYVGLEEELAAPRGRIDFQRSVARQTRRRGRLACAFDELSVDQPFNQILKATARLLLDSDQLSSRRRDEMAGVVVGLRKVSDIRAERSILGRIQIQGDLRRYRGALAVCDLVLGCLLPSRHGRGSKFAEVLEDEVRMAAVFEEFLRNFYRLEQSDFSVGSEVMRWDAEAEVASWSLLPVMRTDITLRSAKRVVVADAKYYASAFSGAGEKPKLHSAHLYQLFAYMEHADRGTGAVIDGLLVYPKVDDPLSARFSVRAHGVRAEAIDLTAPWPTIRQELLSYLQPAMAS